MSIIGTYKHSGVTASNSQTSDSIVNIGGFQPSGLEDSNILGVAMYCWSGNYSDGDWIPLKVDYLK